VNRTKNRPLASGKISNYKAVLYLGLNLSLGLGILTQLNTYTMILGACSLPLVIAYPLMKRFTFYPQAFLGITFNWGALLGFSAVTGGIDPTVVIPLYLGSVNWTLFYDTIYALQDKKDDLKAGIKSTAIRFGDNLKYYLAFFGFGTFAFLGLSGYNNRQSWIYYAGLVASASHLFVLYDKVNLKDGSNAGRIFASSVKTGWILYAGILVDIMAKKINQENGKRQLKDQ
jgi:4-hydroxybenzoate polyprenyltransferase